MPLYEFKCLACGHLTEVIQRLSDPPLAQCPECGGAVEKQLSAPAFQFKGSGWYVTDYARKDKPEAKAGGGKGGESGGEKSSSGGADKSDKPSTAASAKSDKKSKPAASSTSD